MLHKRYKLFNVQVNTTEDRFIAKSNGHYISWSDENFVVSMRDARGYFSRHIFKKIM
jgi:uncharacterized protein with NRDE domain